MNEGSLSTINKLFIRPLVDLRPEGMSLKTWLCYIFHVDDRTIVEYISTKAFQLPGLYKILPTRGVAGYGNRSIPVGKHLWIRRDRTMPNRIDVEVLGTGRTEQVFQLTQSQYHKITPHITLAPLPHRRARKVKFKY